MSQRLNKMQMVVSQGVSAIKSHSHLYLVKQVKQQGYLIALIDDNL